MSFPCILSTHAHHTQTTSFHWFYSVHFYSHCHVTNSFELSSRLQPPHQPWAQHHGMSPLHPQRKTTPRAVGHEQEASPRERGPPVVHTGPTPVCLSPAVSVDGTGAEGTSWLQFFSSIQVKQALLFYFIKVICYSGILCFCCSACLVWQSKCI